MVDEPQSQDHSAEDQQALLVEDDPDVLPLTSQILQHLGFQVTAFSQGDEALRWFRKHHQRMDLAMLDRRLPGIGGGALFRAMHSMAPRVPIIVYSGDISTQEETQLRSEGVSCVLRKPISVRRFSDAISQVMGSER